MRIFQWHDKSSIPIKNILPQSLQALSPEKPWCYKCLKFRNAARKPEPILVEVGWATSRAMMKKLSRVTASSERRTEHWRRTTLYPAFRVGNESSNVIESNQNAGLAQGSDGNANIHNEKPILVRSRRG